MPFLSPDIHSYSGKRMQLYFKMLFGVFTSTCGYFVSAFCLSQFMPIFQVMLKQLLFMAICVDNKKCSHYYAQAMVYAFSLTVRYC